MGRRSKRKDIVQAAAVLVAQRGLDAVSISDVAKAAGVRAASVYRIFASKEELAEEILHLVNDEAVAFRRDFLNSDASPEEKVKATIFYAIHDSPALDIHRRVLQRALVDRDLQTLEALQRVGGGEQSRLVIAALTEMKTGRDPYWLFYLLISSALGFLDFTPFFNMIRPLNDHENEPLYLAETVLKMVLPEIDWSKVRLLDAPSVPIVSRVEAIARSNSENGAA